MIDKRWQKFLALVLKRDKFRFFMLPKRDLRAYFAENFFPYRTKNKAATNETNELFKHRLSISTHTHTETDSHTYGQWDLH